MPSADPGAGRIAGSTWWLVAAACSFLPIGVAWSFGIWPPAATVPEAFSFAYTHLALLREDFHFAYTGHAAWLMLAFPASLLTDAVATQAGNFAKQEIFAYVFYGLHGTLLMAVFVGVWRSRLPMDARWLLLLVPFGVTFIEPVTYLGLYINYHSLDQVLFLVLAWLVMLWAHHDGRGLSWQLAAGVGALGGLAFATKFSLALVFLPYAVALCAAGKKEPAGWRFTRALVCAAAFIGTLLAAYGLYVSLNFTYVTALARSVVGLFGAGFAAQRTPFLSAELMRVLDPAGYYFGLQIVVVVWVVLTAATVAIAARTSKHWLASLVVADTVATFTLLLQLRERQALGTMLDIGEFVVFGSAIKAFALARGASVLTVPRAALAAVATGYVLSVLTGQPWLELRRLAENSRLAREFDLVLSSRSDLPIVFYMDGLAQPLLFPSADLLVAQGAASSSSGARFLQRDHPRIRAASTTASRAPFPHIAVIPEYLDAAARSPEVKAEWPGMYDTIPVLTRNRVMERAYQDAERHVFQFLEVRPRDGLLYFSVYPTRVTVYVAAGTAAESASAHAWPC